MIECYTIKLEDNKLSEFELFDAKSFPDHHSEIEIVYNVLEEMQVRGAKDFYFKTNEGPADALPRVSKEIMDANKEDFGIRLYCIRLTDNLLILLNGDIKTHKDPRECGNVKQHFKRAIAIAAKLDKLCFDKDIDFTEQGSLDDLQIEI